jgi:acetate kinase
MTGSTRVLVLNGGSSSIKYQLRAMPDGALLASGLLERLGESECLLEHGRYDDDGAFTKQQTRLAAPEPIQALPSLFTVLEEISVATRIEAIGHRVVHGGERFDAPVRLDAEVIEAIRELTPLAPLHNPVSLALIEACLARYPDRPQVAVFDTAFHQTLPEAAYRYPVPAIWRHQFGARRYGFHGISHGYLARRAAELLDRDPETTNLILLHLGNGASACAVRGGRSVDTSMGMTPMEGLVMGTRAGDLDPALPFHLGRVAGLTPDAIEHALNHDSGLRGLCGEHDMRAILHRRAQGDAAAGLAFDIYVRRIRKYIGAYLVELGQVDALVFSAGVGEHAPEVRAEVCAGLDAFGLRLDATLNTAATGAEAALHHRDSRSAIYLIPTREELEIARATWLRLQQ